MKARFILNPRAGNPRVRVRLREQVAALIAATGWEARLVATERPAHATELAARALDDGCELVVAIGGDGTMNEVARALRHTPAIFGLVPCGSGNGFGRHLGIPRDPSRAFAILRGGQPRTIDSGELDGHPFFCASGMGFEAVIAQQFLESKQRGFATYLRMRARTFLRYRPATYSIEAGPSRIATRAFTLAIANAEQYGNNAFIAPGARLDDGALDLVAVPALRFANVAPLVWHLFRRSLTANQGVVRLTGPAFVIRRDTSGPIHTDGEVYEAPAEIVARVLPGSLRVMAPAISSGSP